MGLSLNKTRPSWGCFRNSHHAGHSPVRLVAALLGIRLAAALALIDQDAPPIDEFDAAVNRLREQPAAEESNMVRKVIELDPDLRQFGSPFNGKSSSPYETQFVGYLASRGFGLECAQDVVDNYELYYALTGRYAWRLVFPIYDRGELVGLTGREIRKANGPIIRYMTNPEFDKDVLLQWPRPADHVIVCEGPMDALKLDYYGADYKCRAVATLGTSVTPAQMQALRHLRSTGAELVVVFDAEAVADGMLLAEEIGGRWQPLPDDVGDPGEMGSHEAKKFCRSIDR